MSHYSIDVYCKKCKKYLYSFYNEPSDKKYCDTCQEKIDKKKLSNMDFWIKYYLKETK